MPRCGLTPLIKELAEIEVLLTSPDTYDEREEEAIAWIKTYKDKIMQGGRDVSPLMKDVFDNLCALCAEEADFPGDLGKEPGSIAMAYMRDPEVAELVIQHARNERRNDIGLLEKVRDRVAPKPKV